MRVGPILMSGPMVVATLSDWKTKTRRIVKPQPSHFYDDYNGGWECGTKGKCALCGNEDGSPVVSPYGQPGDLLWVRETCEYSTIHSCGENGCECEDFRIEYTAGGYGMPCGNMPADWGFDPGRKYPSIFMPRWASRLTLEITDVRVERLQDINGDDAIAEGIERINDGQHWAYKDYLGHGQKLSPCFSFESLWRSINGAKSWDVNPWVWVLGFKVHKMNINQFLNRRPAAT